mgnify:CR=1 FL=1
MGGLGELDAVGRPTKWELGLHEIIVTGRAQRARAALGP